jgi:hypothetical protein
VEERVQAALVYIETAQNNLARAAACLAPLAGGASWWRRASRLHLQVKALWYALEASKRARWVVDGANDGRPFDPGNP